MIRALDQWFPAWFRSRPWTPTPGEVTDVMIAVCDHFEPFHGVDKEAALNRVAEWTRLFPKLIKDYPDSDSIHPRHTFFYPIEQYDHDVLAALEQLCLISGAEVEIHLHHANDTAAGLTRKLEEGKERFAWHGFLPRDRDGELRFGFIHGNWALANSHPAGKHCGVAGELSVLKQAGCYADFTLPSAPDPTQTRVINSIYYAAETGLPKPQDVGVRAKAGVRRHETNPGELLLVQGPLGLNFRRRKWGLLPRLENGELSAANPPNADRLRLWMRLGIRVEGRPDWLFIKLHTHGGLPAAMKTLLGPPMRSFYESLLSICSEKLGLRVHFVTAREMVNIIHAAEDGKAGNPGPFRDHRYLSRLSAVFHGSPA